MLAFSRSLSMPDAPFDDLMTELGGPYEDETPLSAGLDTLDMQLPSMELTPDMQGQPGSAVQHKASVMHADTLASIAVIAA